MFVIKINDDVSISANKLQDDFLRYLPHHAGVDKSEIEVWHIPEDIESQMKTKTFDFSNAGYAQEVDGDGNPIGSPNALEKMQSWPYDESNDFVGFDFA